VKEYLKLYRDRTQQKALFIKCLLLYSDDIVNIKYY